MIVEKITKKEHFTQQGLANIIQLKLTQRKKAKVDEMYKFIEVKPSSLTPKIPSVYMVTLTEQFLIGLIDGDG